MNKGAGGEQRSSSRDSYRKCGFNVAGGAFLTALGLLKNFPFVDAKNKNAAGEKWFSLQARAKGFRY